MKFDRILSGLVLLALAFLASCASPYTPSPNRPFEPIPEFRSSATVKLVNVQEDAEYHKYGGGMKANYQEWTDVAIEIAEREITKRGVEVQGDAERSISMAITHVKYNVGWVKIWTDIEMKVETGDGYQATYTAKNSSTMAAVPKRQVDGAMMRIVVEMLKDPEIVQYLAGTLQ